jgi:MFS transporter, ACS family, pantothenate transporter
MAHDDKSADISIDETTDSGASSPISPSNKASPDAAATALVQEEPKRSWRSYVWDTLDKSPEERKFLFKLDAVLLTFASLGYFIKYLDQVNVSNAFVSGMKEDLNLYGNQLNYMQTLWTVGYVLGEIPR